MKKYDLLKIINNGRTSIYVDNSQSMSEGTTMKESKPYSNCILVFDETFITICLNIDIFSNIYNVKMCKRITFY